MLGGVAEIGVQHDDHVTRGVVESEAQGMAEAKIERGMEDPDLRMAGRELVGDRAGPVGAAIVNDQNLPAIGGFQR